MSGHWISSSSRLAASITVGGLLAFACGNDTASFSAQAPARGPSEMLQNNEVLNDGDYSGGDEARPAVASLVSPERCGANCQAHCESADLANPVNRGLCTSLWGRGLASNEINELEACRRLYADVLGRFPSLEEVKQDCVGAPWDQLVQQFIDSEQFVRLGRQRWSDRLRYDSITVSLERIFDADRIAEMLYQGRISYGQFASVISAHPVLTRRHNTDGERTDALYETFLGRPAFADERSDIGRLYHQWENGYYDHPQLGLRLPDAYIRYRCSGEGGSDTENSAGACTSVRYGTESVAMQPDTRSDENRNGRSMWSGYLTAQEWEVLQAPGRLISTERVFWEHSVKQVAELYLGYDLVAAAPLVGQELTDYFLTHQGDVRALHFAILTSAAYRQSNQQVLGAELPFARGPIKQTNAEVWVNSINELLSLPSSQCDFRVNRPRELIDSEGPFGLGLVANSDWVLNEEGTDIQGDYRDLTRTLGGCPDNSQGGRFKVVSVLSTANQLNYAGRRCDPTLEQNEERTDVQLLLPTGVSPDAAVTSDLARQIVRYQTEHFFGREATAEQLTAAEGHGESCALSQCSAEEFARPVCFALLSSAEMLFY